MIQPLDLSRLCDECLARVERDKFSRNASICCFLRVLDRILCESCYQKVRSHLHQLKDEQVSPAK